jgi:hypothetical protein
VIQDLSVLEQCEMVTMGPGRHLEATKAGGISDSQEDNQRQLIAR